MKRKKYYLCIKAVGEGAYLANYKPCNGDFAIKLSARKATDLIFLINSRNKDKDKREEPMQI